MPSAENLEITVDREECTGCGACVTEAPETFDLDDDNIAFVKETPADDVSYIVSAAENCPIDAITVVDKENGQRLYPEA